MKYSASQIKRQMYWGCFWFPCSLALSLFHAARHNWFFMAVAASGVVAATMGLWCNGSMDGMRFMKDLWRPDDSQ